MGRRLKIRKYLIEALTVLYMQRGAANKNLS